MKHCVTLLIAMVAVLNIAGAARSDREGLADGGSQSWSDLLGIGKGQAVEARRSQRFRQARSFEHILSDTTEDETAKLQGAWVRVYVHVDGKKTEDGKKKPDEAITLTIKGDKFGDETFKLDPTKQPKHIDLASVDDKGKAITLPGIYELKGDELKVCFPFPFRGKFDKIGKRPTEFGSKRGGNEVLEVYRRMTP